MPIAAAGCDTGLSKDTLRVWERRCGFPQPERDAAGDRACPPEQVKRLQTIRRLLDALRDLRRQPPASCAKSGSDPNACDPNAC